MKRLLLLLITLNQLVSGQVIAEFKTGTSFGFCLGYCLSDLTISDNNLNYILYGWDENETFHSPVTITDTVDSTVWEDLKTYFNFELFMSLDSIIGCPDCADGGAEWFEIVRFDTVKRVTIEYGESLEGLNNFIDLFRSVRHSFQDVQSCYFTPNIGPCDAAFPKYYYNQEENECLEFTWGGCEGLVPFETLEDCKSSCESNRCTDLVNIDFGDCQMALGIGLINNNCEYISGCDWIADSVDYTEAFFTSMDSCQQTCLVLQNDNYLSFPLSYHLYNNYPNPFNPLTTLRYYLPKDNFVKFTIYDMLGNVVNNLVNKNQNSGSKSIQWDATNNQGEPVSAGVYLYKIQAGDYSQTKKMILLK